MEPITLYKNNPYSVVLTITCSDGTIVDLTGKTVFFTVKKLSDKGTDDTNAVISQTITSHTNGAAGITTLSLTATQTNIALGCYKYDFRVYDDTPLVQLNSVSGTLNVKDIVTKKIV